MKTEEAYVILDTKWVTEEINRLKDGLSKLEKTHESLIKERDTLLSDKRDLEVGLQVLIKERAQLEVLFERSAKKYTETISIDKYELTAILRDHYGYAEGNIMNRPWFDIIFQCETVSEDK